MANILDGKQVAAVLNEKLRGEVARLRDRNITPTLAIVRVGERGDDIAYEKGAIKRCETIGVAAKCFVLPRNAAKQELLDVIEAINDNDAIHGCLLFRPLPKHMDDNVVRNALAPAKDIDGITNDSLAGVFAGTDVGFPPCTAQACMEILDYYGFELKGKRAAVIGRSLVVGKPVAMMLMSRHATVTVCHTRTVDISAICRSAEILIAAAGRAGMAGKEFFSPGQVVIDVGIDVGENGKMCGDTDFAAAEQIVGAITPVPGGVGTVTTSVLVKHTVEAAKRV
jgi:methylenetetrahydrofolate dehydrogenase (NADP+)/methenyltetrahydrofolate cyclohydrolase